MSLAHAGTTVEPQANAPGASLLHCRVVPPGVTVNAAAIVQRLSAEECGAVVTFEGIVRKTENGRTINGLIYEAHPDMAQQELERVCLRAMDQFEIDRVACEHRTGFVAAEQPSIAIAISSAHRKAAFSACQYILDELKRIVPIWKSPDFIDEIPVGGTA